MINDNEPITVRNMVDHKVVYTLPEINRRVVFEPFQEKKVPASELRALNYTIGGNILIHNYLCILNDEMREEFNIPKDLIEYDWTIKDIHNILENLNTPIEALEDALDFAPQGIRELIIDSAVKWKIPDSNRRKVISRMAGVNIDKMIEFAELTEQTVELPETRTRRLSAQEAPRTGRRIQN